MGGVCNTHGKMRNPYNNFVRKPEGKGPLGRPRSRCEDKIDLNERGCEGLKWIKVRFQVLTTASMKMAVFWDVARCSLVRIDVSEVFNASIIIRAI
jgi:hypothetical protein